MARALDKLFVRGPNTFFSIVCLRAVCQEKIFLKCLQNDTTPISVHEDSKYEEPTDPNLSLPIIIRLKQLSRRLDLPVIVVSSFNRVTYSWKHGPSIAAFKEAVA